MVPVARRNLFSEKGRFAISVAGVAFAVLLILIVLALYRGFSHSGQTFSDLPGELWITQQGTTDPFHSVSLIDRVKLDAVSSAPGVAAVVPVLSRQMSFLAGGSETSARLLALEIPESVQLPQELRDRYLPPQGRTIIDSTLSRKTGLREGDTVAFGAISLTIDRVAPRSGEALQQFAFVAFQDAERIFGVGNIVNYGMVMLTPGAAEQDVARAIARQPGVAVFTKQEFATSIRKEIDESFLPIITILLVIGFVVGAAVVGLTIYTATIERSREFGVMKAVGGSPAFLYHIVLSQSAMLTAAGFIVGLGAAVGVARLAAQLVPEFVTDFQPQDVAGVLAAAAAMAVLASFVPVRRINSIDPAIVFRA
ncbi:MAG: ABC transporter permease [Chloroflexi bacterium]|nr:ABC transporter permease [Chloroflexota bacterium]